MRKIGLFLLFIAPTIVQGTESKTTKKIAIAMHDNFICAYSIQYTSNIPEATDWEKHRDYGNLLLGRVQKSDFYLNVSLERKKTIDSTAIRLEKAIRLDVLDVLESGNQASKDNLKNLPKNLISQAKKAYKFSSPYQTCAELLRYSKLLVLSLDDLS